MTLIEVSLWLLIAIAPPAAYIYLNSTKAQAIPIGGPEKEGHSSKYRSVRSPVEIVSVPSSKLYTMYELMKFSATTYKTKNMFGERSIKGIVEEEKMVKKIGPGGKETTEKKVWKYFELSSYNWLTYNDVYTRVMQIGAGLRGIGLNPTEKLTIFAPTNRDWMMMAHGCFSQNITITTAYDTLGEEGLAFSLNEGKVTALFTTSDLLNMMSKISKMAPSLKLVIYGGKIEVDALAKIKKECSKLKIYSIAELLDLGAKKPVEPTPPKPNEVACIMYTSGSTGNPKGVILTHANIIASLAGVEHELHHTDVYLAYLPLAHILEFLVENTCIFLGIPLGYGNPRTLTDASVRNCLGDIRELKPTLMAGVPAVWESIRKGVLGKVDMLSPVMKVVFDSIFQIKWTFMQMGLPVGVFDALIFNKIKDQTGGRLRFALSGGAPIPRETHRFLTVCVCPVIQGYGMTESCGVIAIQAIDQAMVLGSVGAVSPAVETKLVSFENYKSSNTPPQGELWVRGPSITTGYYQQSKLTAECITEDGWLMTGDIGEISADGCISIIDRKKNLIKLEAIYKSSTIVQHVMIYANSEKSFAIALIVPIEKEIKKFINENQIGGHFEHLDDLEHFKEIERLNELVLEDLKSVAKKAGLKGAEIIGGAALCNEDWTPQNGYLTAAMKLKRKDIGDKYRSKIDKLYK